MTTSTTTAVDLSPGAFMTAAIPAQPIPSNGNTPWAAQYARELRDIVINHANNSSRNLQKHLGPSEIGAICHRQVVGKLAQLPAINHTTDPWASIVGTALHSWMEECLSNVNELIGRTRFLTEHRVTPIGFEAHPGTGDGYDYDTATVIDHKGVYVDTPVATPWGWTTVGRLSVGDEVFGSDGQPCRVTKVYPVQQRDCFRVRFTDGTELITDDVQELPFMRKIGKRLCAEWSSVTTARALVWSKGARPQRQLRLYNGIALELPERELAVHPYVLGCWLGDGGVHGGAIGSGDAEIFDHIEACGYQLGAPIGVKAFSRTVYGLTTQLQALGLQWRDSAYPLSHRRLTGVKAIPGPYLRASRDQRLALLQGLMDTDGSWNKARHRAVFITTSKDLARGVTELITSLGWKAHSAPQQATGFGRTVEVFHVEFTPFGANPFRLSRKADRVRPGGSLVASYRVVHSIEPTVSVPTRCIDVDSADHLYRCGAQMLPVHNCLGRTNRDKLKTKGAPRHYFVQTLLYALGFMAMGLPVHRVALIAWPRTESYLDDLYVWEHVITDEDLRFLVDVIQPELAYRKQWAAAIVTGQASLMDVPADTSDECHFCPQYRPASARDGQPGCPGHATGRH